MKRADVVFVRDDDLAWGDIADEGCADHVERAAFGCQDRGVAQFTEHERTNAERIARADQEIIGEEGERVSAFELVQSFNDAIDDVSRCFARDEVQDGFGIAGGLENRAAFDEHFS